MKKIIMPLLAAAAIIFMPSCGHKHEADELAHHHHHAHEAEHQHSPAHHHEDEEAEEHAGESEITLEPEMAERFGVETETAAYRPFADVIKVTGEIINSASETAVVVAPTSGVIKYSAGIENGLNVAKGKVIATVNSASVAGANSNLAAKANYDAAKRELDRLTPLFEEKLVTASEYNAALRAFDEAKANYSQSAGNGAAVSPISGIILSLDAAQGQFVEAGTPIAVIASSKTLTLRADVPQRYYNQIASITDAAIVSPYSDIVFEIGSHNGKRTDTSKQVASKTKGYIPVYFSFDNDGSMIAGSNVEVYLSGTESSECLSVPLSALSEQQGLYYVYIRLDEDCYRKSLVKTGRSNGERIEIISGLEEGEDVVVKGTTTVRIAESSGVVPEGHTHNH